jgi:hypothetical protein
MKEGRKKIPDERGHESSQEETERYRQSLQSTSDSVCDIRRREMMMMQETTIKDTVSLVSLRLERE